MAEVETRYEGQLRGVGEDGRAVTIDYWQNYTVVRSSSGVRRAPGGYELKTDDGETGDFVDPQTIRLHGSDEIIRLSSPARLPT